MAYKIGDFLQWREYDAEVVGVWSHDGRERVTVECFETNGTSFTVNILNV